MPAIEQHVKGKGNVAIVNGRIENFDMIGDTLEQLFKAGGVGGLLSQGQKTGGHKTTRFESLTMDVSIADARIDLEKMQLHNMYTEKETGADAILEGLIGFDQSLDLKGRVVLSKKHSKEIVSKAKILEALQNEKKRIVFPLTLGGVLTSPKPRVDGQYVIKAIAKHKGKKLLKDAEEPVKDLLEGLFGGKKKKKKKK